jgi:hypothetical protein
MGLHLSTSKKCAEKLGKIKNNAVESHGTTLLAQDLSRREQMIAEKNTNREPMRPMA